MSGQEGVRRILQVHTRYRQAGGEDRAVEAERVLLEEAGLDVRQVIFDNADLRESRSLGADLRLAASAIWSPGAARRVADAIRADRPDVVHVHNTFAAASPSVYGAAARLGVPVVQTLHNYRLACPAATLFRNGHPCTDCVHAWLPAPAVIHACVRGSRSQSLVAAATIGVHRRIGTFADRIDRYVALTTFQRRLIVDAGLPDARVHVIPNFLEPDPGASEGSRSGVLFVGRLSIEKGIDSLLVAASHPAMSGLLDVAGDGPLASQVAEAATAGLLRYLGPLAGDEVARRMRNVLALLVPSIWYEGFPMVVLEAYATGTPVIAARIGSLEEVIDDGETGLLVTPGDPEDLARAIRWAVDHPDKMAAMGAAARQRYEDRYRGPDHLAALLDVYASTSAAPRR